MKYLVKVSLILCFFAVVPLRGQTPYDTNGKFTFINILPIPDTYEIGPGQVSKSGDHFLIGLTDGDLENMAYLHSDIYRYALDLNAPPLPLTGFDLRVVIDSFRIFQVTASKNENDLVFVANAYSGWNDNELAIAQKQADGKYGPITLLKGLNNPTESDAYPWISEDGLELYYTRNFKVMYAQRESRDVPFSSALELKFKGDVQLEIVGIWLSPNRKKMFLVANNNIYVATRKKVRDTFELPQMYTDEFAHFYFISGLSFAPDGKNAYLYYSDEQGQQILHYKLKKGKAW